MSIAETTNFYFHPNTEITAQTATVVMHALF